MEIKKLYEKYAYRLICCFFLTSSAVIYVNIRTGAVLNEFFTIIAALFFSLAAVVFDILAKKPVLYITAGAALAALFIFALVFDIPVIETINASFVWLLYESGEQAVFSYALISILLAEAVTALILFGVLRFYYVRLTAGAALLVAVIIFAFLEINVGGFVVFFIISFIIAVLCELFLKKINCGFASSLMLPFILIAGLMVAVLPSQQEPIQWTFVKNVIENFQNLAHKIGNSFTVLFNSEAFQFSISMTGYSESGGIFGGLTPSDREALVVKQNFSMGKSLYLTGTVMDRYTGNGWERTDAPESEGLNEYEIDYLETLLLLYNNGLLDNEYRDDVFAVREIEIAYRDLKTKSLFYPLKTLRMSSVYPFDIKKENIILKNVSDEKTSYRLKYLDINYNSGALAGLLGNGGTENNVPVNSSDFYEKIAKYMGGVSLNGIPENYQKLLNVRREEIKARYTVLPDSVGNEIYELSRDITANCENDYDKMKALETFLSGYKYTLTPPAFSGGEVSRWFLFEAREGYCTHFATSLAVMARTLGIPVRYVQGYITDFGEKTGTDRFIIRDRNAHAWVEAYIDGIGWTPFEAVPSYSSVRYPEWRKKSAGTRETAPPDIDYNLEQYYSEIPEEEPTEQEEDGGVFLSLLLIIGVTVTAAMIAAAATFALHLYRKKRKTGTADIASHYLGNFKLLMLFLNILDYGLEEGETLKCFSLRVKDNKLNEIISVHQRVRYDGQTPEIAELSGLLEYKEEIAERVMKKTGRLKYYMLIINN